MHELSSIMNEVKLKAVIRAQLEADMKKFLEAGGVITHCQPEEPRKAKQPTHKPPKGWVEESE